MSVFLPNGVGDYPLGDPLVHSKPLQVSGNVWYVSSVTGAAPPNRGKAEERPLATLDQAVTAAADHDVIVLLPGHTETLGAPLTISKSVIILGASAVAGVPDATFKRTGAFSLFVITAPQVQLRNVRIRETPTPGTPIGLAVVRLAASRCRLVGCYLSGGDLEAGPLLELDAGADQLEVRSCKFDSVGTLPVESAIKSTASVSDLRIFGSTFDGKVAGFSNFYAIDLSFAACTRTEMEEIALLHGADIKLHPLTTGYVHIEQATGGARVDF